MHEDNSGIYIVLFIVLALGVVGFFWMSNRDSLVPNPNHYPDTQTNTIVTPPSVYETNTETNTTNTETVREVPVMVPTPEPTPEPITK